MQVEHKEEEVQTRQLLLQLVQVPEKLKVPLGQLLMQLVTERRVEEEQLRQVVAVLLQVRQEESHALQTRLFW